MTGLKPCPFCGGETEELEPPRRGFWMGFWRIRCTKCGAMVNGTHRSMNIDAWNRRAERTCRDASQYDEWLMCSECGAFTAKLGVTDAVSPIPIRYCPNCGSKVVVE